MEFTEMEKRMLYQTEGCERYVVINELSMASQYAGDPARRKAAKDLMENIPCAEGTGEEGIFPSLGQTVRLFCRFLSAAARDQPRCDQPVFPGRAVL